MNLNNLPSPRSLSKLFFLFTTCFLTASIKTVGQTGVVAVMPVKMNVFYIGVDNPVAIAASGANDDKVTVSIDGGNGSVSKLGAGNYVVRVGQVTDDCTIQVAVDGKSAGTSKFRVRSLPTPTATVGGFSSGSNVPANSFLTQAGVGMYVKDFPFDVKYEVVDYTFTIDDNNGGIKTAGNEGSSFTSQIKQFIQENVKPGKTITIDDIKAKAPDGTIRKVPALVYFIK